MGVLVALIATSVFGFFIYVFAYVVEKEEARKAADEFIAGIRKPTLKDIEKCIRRLQVTNKRLLSGNEPDRRRVELLRSLQDDSVTSHP